MHERTGELAAAVRGADEVAAQLELLRGALQGAPCVIVTCGPSLKAFERHELETRLDGVVVIAVKQAIDVVGSAADFLCFNPYNVSRYRTPAPETIRVLCADPGRQLPQLNRCDLTTELARHEADLDESLAGTAAFDDHTLAEVALRPWGPGIVYELAIYLAVHLGVGELGLVGWDIGNAGGNNVHFYDDQRSASFFDRGRAARPLAAVRSRQPDRLKRMVRWTRAAGAHWRGRVYNRTTMLPGEAELVAASSGPLARWLRTQGIEPFVVSDRSLASPELPRMEKAEFLSWAATTGSARSQGGGPVPGSAARPS